MPVLVVVAFTIAPHTDMNKGRKALEKKIHVTIWPLFFCSIQHFFFTFQPAKRIPQNASRIMITPLFTSPHGQNPSCRSPLRHSHHPRFSQSREPAPRTKRCITKSCSTPFTCESSLARFSPINQSNAPICDDSVKKKKKKLTRGFRSALRFPSRLAEPGLHRPQPGEPDVEQPLGR